MVAEALRPNQTAPTRIRCVAWLPHPGASRRSFASTVRIPSVPTSKPITRFAPSPTGALHIGSARTALFNWALARRHGGQFILRIEDTDKARSSDAATAGIVGDLKWLGLDWDQGPSPLADRAADPRAGQIGPHGPYFQSQRHAIYEHQVERLLADGRAYRCFKSAQELAAERDEARAAKRRLMVDPTHSRRLSRAQIARFQRQGRPSVIRFHMPDGPISVTDQVLGQVTVPDGQVEDFILVRSDDRPTYHLAVVVDDALMGVTCIIRGQEHLDNTIKHAALQDALGFARPLYTHLPLILNPDGSKMSKREKARIVRQAAAKADLRDLDGVDDSRLAGFLDGRSDDPQVAEAVTEVLGVALPEIDLADFRASGYLPQVICNYISLLGWSPGSDIERFDLDHLKAHFGLDRIGKANARFDRQKLKAFNAETISQLPRELFHDTLQAFLRCHDAPFAERLGDRFDLFADAYQPRSATLQDPAHLGRFFVTADEALTYDAKSTRKVLARNADEGYGVLRDLAGRLAACPAWTTDAIDEVVATYSQEHHLSMGKVAQPLRVAVSGGPVSPPIGPTLLILGKASTLRRIERCLQADSAK